MGSFNRQEREPGQASYAVCLSATPHHCPLQKTCSHSGWSGLVACFIASPQYALFPPNTKNESDSEKA